ncbi:MAG: DUF393 domain-containing protein [Myxococcales bacterium]|nr:DUF393 domain-containing protein [Myxococcales bacterium]
MSDKTWRHRLGWTGLRTWFGADPRALGLFRIAFGTLAMLDVLRRWPYLEMLYSNEGLHPNHWHLYQHATSHQFSLLFALSRPGEVAVFFSLTLVSLLLFTVGWHTKVFHVLSALLMWSIHGRVPMIENGGDVVMNLWWLWTLALPLGRRFSVDALRADLRTHPDKAAGDLNRRLPPERGTAWSLGVTAVLWQYVVIYFFNTVHKNGGDWQDGSALAWVLHQDRIITPFGRWWGETLPYWTTEWLTYGTLVVEGAAVVLLLTPLFGKWARRITLTTLVGLHGGIWLMTDVGYFSPTMIVGYLILIAPEDIELLKRALRALARRPVQVWYDSDCGVCHLLARVGARMDRLGTVTWYGRDPDAPLPPGWTAEQLAEQREVTLIAAQPETGAVFTRHHALAAIVDALPAGRLVGWLLRLPGVGHLAGWGYDRFAAQRHKVSAWIGLGVCGLAPAGQGAQAQPVAPTTLGVQRFGFLLTQGLIVFGLVCTNSQLLVENHWLRRRVPHIQPTWAKAFIGYGRFFQGWSMFAPSATKQDGGLIIEATLEDGTVVDPQTGLPPRFAPVSMRHQRWDQFWGSYSMRIASRRNSGKRKYLKEWLLRPGPKLALDGSQRIVEVKVWWLGDQSPDPRVGGEPTEVERYIVVEGKAPRRSGNLAPRK